MPAWCKFGLFCFIGLAGAALQLLLLFVMERVYHLAAVEATALAVEIVVVHNFLLHERFTWSERKTTTLQERFSRFWRFQTGNGFVSLVGNTTLIYCFAELLRIPSVPSALAAIAVCSLINFLLAEHWVYR